MSFSGKKFQRVRSENLDEYFRANDTSQENFRKLLHGRPPVFSFTKLSEDTYMFQMYNSELVMLSHTFRLGEEVELERRDGAKLKVIYELESENVLRQVVQLPNGRKAHFRREFNERCAKMTVRLDGSDVVGTVYFEVVDDDDYILTVL